MVFSCNFFDDVETFSFTRLISYLGFFPDKEDIESGDIIPNGFDTNSFACTRVVPEPQKDPIQFDRAKTFP